MTELDYTRIDTLPNDHHLRSVPLAGARFRAKCWHGEDISVPVGERGEDWKRWDWSTWRTVTDRWRIAVCCYNDLGGIWTKEAEWMVRKDTNNKTT